MKKLLCLVALVLPGMLFAQSPFDGTWKTDPSQAKLTQKPFDFVLSNGTYSCSSCAPKLENVKADGQDQNVAAPGRDYDTLAVKVVDDHNAQFTGKKAGKPVFESTRNASSDGNTLTISSTNYPADGSQPYKSGAKFTRVGKAPAGANATSGSWRVQSFNEDAAGSTSMWKSSGDGLSWSNPTGESWDAKFDGKDYPVKGTYVNETVSLKRMGDNGIETTFKRDGKVWSIEKSTVSPDGKKMTTVVDNKQTGRTSTFVDVKQ